MKTDKTDSDPLMRRDVSITVKMTSADLDYLKECSSKVWPGAQLSQSSMILSLAKAGAKALCASLKILIAVTFVYNVGAGGGI